MNLPNDQGTSTRWFADAPAGGDATPDVPALDADLPTLDDAGARRLNVRALWVLGGSVAVLTGLMLWMGTSMGGDATAAPVAGSARTSVETPSLPDSGGGGAEGTPANGMGGSGGVGTGSAPPADASLPPLPPEPVQLSAGTPANMTGPVESWPPPAAASPMAVPPARASLVQRRIWNGNAPEAASTPGAEPQDALLSMQAAADAPGQGKVRRLAHPSSLLVQGTQLRCALASRIVSDVAGHALCVLVEPVYAHDGRRVLLARGTRLLGRYGPGGGAGDRLAVLWHRALTPEGLDVDLGGEGMDTLGSAGHPGRGDSHWGQRITSALMVSVLSDAFKYAAARHGPRETAIYAGGTVVSEPFESNTAQTAQELATQALMQGAGRPRTITLPQGTLLSVWVTEDIDFHGMHAEDRVR